MALFYTRICGERRRRRATHTNDNAKKKGDRSVSTPDTAEPRRVSLAFGADDRDYRRTRAPEIIAYEQLNEECLPSTTEDSGTRRTIVAVRRCGEVSPG